MNTASTSADKGDVSFVIFAGQQNIVSLACSFLFNPPKHLNLYIIRSLRSHDWLLNVKESVYIFYVVPIPLRGLRDAPENFTFPFVTKRRPIAFSHSWSHVHITHGPAGRTTG